MKTMMVTKRFTLIKSIKNLQPCKKFTKKNQNLQACKKKIEPLKNLQPCKKEFLTYVFLYVFIKKYYSKDSLF